MTHKTFTPAHSFFPGMGQAVAERTIVRKIKQPVPLYHETIELPRVDGTALDAEVAAWCKSNNVISEHYEVLHGDELIVRVKLHITDEIVAETWEDVAHRVALGNTMLFPPSAKSEYDRMHHHLRQASILMSGRHLQHGDETQPTRPQEVFTNCSTAAANFLTFYLLLNGSGVGRDYSDEMMVVDYADMPIVVTTIDQHHKDVQSGEIVAQDIRNAKHLYAGRTIKVFEVPDSREGWAKALEKIELAAFLEQRREVLILDFSKVRERGAPIGGMQNRPASGPGPLMEAINKIAKLRDAGMEPWRSTMYADHYAAECVLVGGARRAARMAAKFWKDKNVLDFIQVKRGGFMWSSNNSVLVDAEFWRYVKMEVGEGADWMTKYDAAHAKAVFRAITEAAYHDGTGEPGFINVDMLTWNETGLSKLQDGAFIGSSRYELDKETLELTKELAGAWSATKHKVIVNPCGEIVLSSLAGYCVLATVVPFHAGGYKPHTGFLRSAENMKAWDNDAEDAFGVAARALIRTNMMDSLYAKEVKRTNRIGVGITALHEWAWVRFGYGWKDIVCEEKSLDMWLMLSRFARAVTSAADEFSDIVGLEHPHTLRTMKPDGTIAKLFGLTEGAHLPSMREFLRWVQFRNDDPLVEVYRAKGYPVRKLTTYNGTTIVGFPTQPVICSLGMGNELVTAPEATPDEQFEYLRLLEKYWITGVEADGVTPCEERGNQVSYTLKFDPKVVSFDAFKKMLLDNQSTVRCCSVMPTSDTSAYEYLPETQVTKAEYQMIADAIQDNSVEDIGMEHVECANGACPIDFRKEKFA